MGLTGIGAWHLELLRLPGEFVVRADPALRTDADAVYSRVLGQRRVVLRGLAGRRACWRAASAKRVVRMSVVGFALDDGAPGRGDDLRASTSLPVLGALLFIGFGFLGLVIPTTSVMALEDHGEIAGAASALMGTLQMVIARGRHRGMGLFVRRHRAADAGRHRAGRSLRSLRADPGNDRPPHRRRPS